MRRTLVLILSIGFVACVSAREAPDPDLLEVARIGLAEAERSGPRLIVVVSESLPRHTREALASLRTVVSRGQVPPSESFAMLPGYFYLERLELSGTRATFAGVSGAVPIAPPGHIQNSCGSGPSLVLEKRGGTWVIALAGVMAC